MMKPLFICECPSCRQRDERILDDLFWDVIDGTWSASDQTALRDQGAQGDKLSVRERVTQYGYKASPSS